MYSLGTLFVSGIYVYIPCIKEIIMMMMIIIIIIITTTTITATMTAMTTTTTMAIQSTHELAM
jgi:hypothetical protein